MFVKLTCPEKHSGHFLSVVLLSRRSLSPCLLLLQDYTPCQVILGLPLDNVFVLCCYKADVPYSLEYVAFKPHTLKKKQDNWDSVDTWKRNYITLDASVLYAIWVIEATTDIPAPLDENTLPWLLLDTNKKRRLDFS